MIKIYIDPNGNQVPKPSYLNYNGTCYVPPTDEQLEAAGWEIREIIDHIPEPILPTYAELVEQYIREHGYETYGAEVAVINNYTENPTEYLEAWQTYMGVRHAAKEWANEQPHREEE